MMMEIEKPCSLGHCLGMLNDNMRTDILRRVHQDIEARMDQRGKKSPLEILIESIEDVLANFDGRNRVVCVEPNPSTVIHATGFARSLIITMTSHY
jgi:hypothetical protein